MPERFSLTTNLADGRLAVVVAGDLDMDASFGFESELDRIMAGCPVRRLDFDLAGVAFLDSAGLGALLSTRDRAQTLGVETTISRASDAVRRLLELTGAAGLLTA